MKKTYLIFAAHPDDLDFTCAGTAAKMAGEGNRVVYCIITNGEKGIHKVGLPKAKMVAEREREQREASKVVGAERVIFLREKDGELENTKNLRRKLVRVIREIRPDVVLSFDPANVFFDSFPRYHRDHRMAAESVFDALYPAAGSKAFFPEIKLKPHTIKEAWFYGTPRPNLWINISKTMDKKLKALFRQASAQLRRQPP